MVELISSFTCVSWVTPEIDFCSLLITMAYILFKHTFFTVCQFLFFCIPCYLQPFIVSITRWLRVIFYSCLSSRITKKFMARFHEIWGISGLMTREVLVKFCNVRVEFGVTLWLPHLLVAGNDSMAEVYISLSTSSVFCEVVMQLCNIRFVLRCCLLERQIGNTTSVIQRCSFVVQYVAYGSALQPLCPCTHFMIYQNVIPLSKIVQLKRCISNCLKHYAVKYCITRE